MEVEGLTFKPKTMSQKS